MQKEFFESVRDVQTNEYLKQIAEARNAAEPYFKAINPLFIEYGKLTKSTGLAPKLISMHLVSIWANDPGTGVSIGEEIKFVLFEMPTNPIKHFWESKNSLFVMPGVDGKTNLFGRTFFGHDDSGRRQLDIPVVSDDPKIVDRLPIQLKRESQAKLFTPYEGNRIEGEGNFIVKSYPLYNNEIYRPYAKSERQTINEDHVVDAKDMTEYLLGELNNSDFKEHLEIAKKIVLNRSSNVELVWE